MTDTEIFESAIDKYGTDHQIDIAIEEMAELIKALLKRRRGVFNTKDTFSNVCEEIADVEIMIEQLKIIYDFEFIEAFKEQKIERLKQTLEL